MCVHVCVLFFFVLSVCVYVLCFLCLCVKVYCTDETQVGRNGDTCMNYGIYVCMYICLMYSYVHTYVSVRHV